MVKDNRLRPACTAAATMVKMKNKINLILQHYKYACLLFAWFWCNKDSDSTFFRYFTVTLNSYNFSKRKIPFLVSEYLKFEKEREYHH